VSHTDRIAIAIRRSFRRLPGVSTQVSPHRFSVARSGGPPLSGRAELSEALLGVTVELGSGQGLCDDERGPDTRGLRLLEGHSRLPAAVKYVLDGASARLEVRAELPLPGDTGPGRRWLFAQIRDVIDGCLAACAAAHPAGRACASPAIPRRMRRAGRGHDAVSPVGAVALRTACAETGWTVVGGGPTEVRVELPTRGTYRVASLVATHGTTRGSVELDLSGAGGPATRAGLVRFLLCAGAAVRVARPWVRRWGRDPPGLAAGFEVLLASPAPVEVVDAALTALTVACELGAREAEALDASDPLARLYLKVQGTPCRTAPQDAAPTL